jgi:hypothetical protein
MGGTFLDAQVSASAVTRGFRLISSLPLDFQRKKKNESNWRLLPGLETFSRRLGSLFFVLPLIDLNEAEGEKGKRR